MSGGTTARLGFRYQDFCILYVLLSEYSDDNFQYIVCENDKHDFEVLRDDKNLAYQAKSGSALTSNELNEVLKFFTDRFQENLDNSELIFFFADRPSGALSHFFERFNSRGLRPHKSHKTVVKYIMNALSDIDENYNLQVRCEVFNKRDIEDLVRGQASRLLQEMFRVEAINSFTCETFISHLKNKVDDLSAKHTIDDRRISKADVISICRSISSTTVTENPDGTSREITVQAVPEDSNYEIIFRRKSAPKLENLDINDLKD